MVVQVLLRSQLSSMGLEMVAMPCIRFSMTLTIILDRVDPGLSVSSGFRIACSMFSILRAFLHINTCMPYSCVHDKVPTPPSKGLH